MYSSYWQFPTSSIRDEPYRPAQRDTLSAYSGSTSLSTSALSPDCRKYVEETYLQGSHRATYHTTVSFHHPHVGAFIDRLPAVVASVAVDVKEGSLFNCPVDEDSTRIYMPSEALGVELDSLTDESIFTLAALYLLHQPRHRAHFTLWGGSTAMSTTRRVQRIIDTQPSPIIAHNTWLGVITEITLLRRTHHRLLGLEFPVQPEAESAQVQGTVTRAAAKRRKTAPLTRKKGTRHSPRHITSAPIVPVTGPVVVVEVEKAIEDENERPAKRARITTNEDDSITSTESMRRSPTHWLRIFSGIAEVELSNLTSTSEASSRTVSIEPSSRPVSMDLSTAADLGSELTPNALLPPATKTLQDGGSDEESSATCVEGAAIPTVQSATVRRSPRGRKITSKVSAVTTAETNAKAKHVQSTVSKVTATKVTRKITELGVKTVKKHAARLTKKAASTTTYKAATQPKAKSHYGKA